MRVDMCPMISASELEREIEIQYDVEVNIYDLFFFDDPSEGRFRPYDLIFANKEQKEALELPQFYHPEDLKAIQQAYLVTNYLIDVIGPHYSTIIIKL